jgi:hypothetical protein
MLDEAAPITPAVRDRILEQASSASNAREVASVVLNSLVDEQGDAGSCSLEEVKQLMVDALRAFKCSARRRKQRLVG